MGQVWVIEDDDVLRGHYVRFLAAAPRRLEVLAFATTREADAVTSAEEPPDGLILDQMLPGETGLHWLPKHAAYFRRTRVCVVTACADAEMSVVAQSLGAFLVLKPTPVWFLTHFAGAVAARAATRQTQALHAPQAERAASFAERWGLSARQTEVLVLFIRGFRTREIAAELTLGIGTVKKHVHAILDRSQLADMREVVRELWSDAE